MTRRRVDVLATSDALADAAAEAVAGACQRSISARGRFTLALSGGSTPQALYRCLATRGDIDWARVHVVWGDERCVPATHSASNYGMAREALLDRIEVPAAQVYRLRGEAPPHDEARRYEAVLRALVPDGVLDLVLLGLGRDGHTASLFPGHVAGQEQHRWVAEASFDDARGHRLTLTLPLLSSAREVLFLVAGRDKATVLAAVIDGPDQPETLPAQRIARQSAAVRWLVDAEAAEALTTVGPDGP